MAWQSVQKLVFGAYYNVHLFIKILFLFQYHKHLFVHLGPNTDLGDPHLEVITIQLHVVHASTMIIFFSSLHWLFKND